MENFNRFLIRLQKFDVKIIEKEITESKGRGTFFDSPDGEKKVEQYYSLEHEVPEMNQEYEFEMRKLMEMAITDLLNIDDTKIEFHLKRLDALKTAFSEIGMTYYKKSFGGINGTVERRKYIYGLKLADRFNVGLLNWKDQFTIVSKEFLWDFYDAIEFRRRFIDKFQDKIQGIIKISGNRIGKKGDGDLYQEEETGGNHFQNTTSTRKQRKNCGYPVFKKMYIDDIFSALEEHFKGTETELRMLLESGNAESVVCVFNGRCNQLCDLFIKMSGRNLIVSCEKKELIDWICDHFRYRNGAKMSHSNVRKLFGMQIRTKNPLYTIEFSEDENKFLFIPCH